jgi:hypothetical protein
VACAASDEVVEDMSVDIETIENITSTEPRAVTQAVSSSAVQPLQSANSIEQDESTDDSPGSTTYQSTCCIRAE